MWKIIYNLGLSNENLELKFKTEEEKNEAIKNAVKALDEQKNIKFDNGIINIKKVHYIIAKEI